MSWIITGILAAVVALIVWTEMKCGRRNKVFHASLDPEVDALKNSVMAKYRERFGKDPTSEFPSLHLNNGQQAAGNKRP